MAKHKRGRTAERHWLWNFLSLLSEMRSLTRNLVRFKLAGGAAQLEVCCHAVPSPLQQRAFDLLGVRLEPESYAIERT